MNEVIAFYLGGLSVTTITMVGGAIHTRSRPCLMTVAALAIGTILWPVLLPVLLTSEIRGARESS